jgi:hypothetical protein
VGGPIAWGWGPAAVDWCDNACSDVVISTAEIVLVRLAVHCALLVSWHILRCNFDRGL